MTTMFQLTTDRLILTAHASSDAEKMNRWENDAELLDLSDDQPDDRESESLEATRANIERAMRAPADAGIIRYAIRKRDSGEFIGYGIIAHVDRYNRRCRLSVVIGEKREWGKGFASEALRAAIDYSFTTLGMNRIGAEIYAVNERSIRLFERLGFKREGAVRESVLKNGVFVDEYVYGLLRREWE
ncbi:MAG: GNAT family N-acetyltransferase [Elusimicrobia bacterium]|nr:GNAT family N-acetyltransferase [Elusimicrobiota bacterium]